MIGARLFIELGMEPATATRQVRAVRPGQSRRRIKKTTSSGAAITSSTVTWSCHIKAILRPVNRWMTHKPGLGDYHRQCVRLPLRTSTTLGM
jgi:hypothetical protein